MDITAEQAVNVQALPGINLLAYVSWAQSTCTLHNTLPFDVGHGMKVWKHVMKQMSSFVKL
jgi:hypothetical protein